MPSSLALIRIWPWPCCRRSFARQLSTVVHTPADLAAEMAETFGKPQIHPTAVVDPTAELGAGVQVGAHAVISEHVRIGAGSVIYPGVFVGTVARCSGNAAFLFPNVTIYEHVQVGNDVRIHAGSVLGADGFGYAPKTRKDAAGGKVAVTGHQKIYHLGRVMVGDRVEIGALSCIDRGTIDDTRVGRDAKIDNQVHLGHNTHVGRGRDPLRRDRAGRQRERREMGLCRRSDRDRQQRARGRRRQESPPASLLSKDVPPGATAAGNPQREYSEHFRAHALLSRMVKGKRKPRDMRPLKTRYRLNIDQIQKYLPHRAPFLFVDRVLEIHPCGNLSGSLAERQSR